MGAGTCWEEDEEEEECGVVVGRGCGRGRGFSFVDKGGKSSSESLMVIMLGVFLRPFGGLMMDLVVGVAGGVSGDDECEVTVVEAVLA